MDTGAWLNDNDLICYEIDDINFSINKQIHCCQVFFSIGGENLQKC